MDIWFPSQHVKASALRGASWLVEMALPAAVDFVGSATLVVQSCKSSVHACRAWHSGHEEIDGGDESGWAKA